MAGPGPRRMSVEDFYIRQLDRDERNEPVDGLPAPLRATTGASNVHDVILIDAIIELGTRLRGKPCRVASADTALRTSIRSTRRPTAVIGVLSPSTRKIDRFTGLEDDRRHPSLRHSLLVDPDTIAAKLYSRPEGGAWGDVDLIGRDARIDFDAVGVSPPLAALYERLEMPD